MSEVIIKCACFARDAYECWAHRYGFAEYDHDEIEHDGGPCECACHDEDAP